MATKVTSFHMYLCLFVKVATHAMQGDMARSALDSKSK